MKVYLTICYDQSEQQTFWDYVPANNEEEARDAIGAVRGEYSDIVGVIDSAELTSMAGFLRQKTPHEAAADMDELLAAHGEGGAA